MESSPKLRLLGDSGRDVSGLTRLLPFERRGRKFVIKPKQSVFYLAVLVLTLSLAQAVLNNDKETQLVVSPMGSPDTIVVGSVPSGITDPAPASPSEKPTHSQNHARKNEKKFAGPQVIRRPLDLSQIPPGVIFPARMLGSASNGLARAEVTGALSVNGDEIIPSGTVLVGEGQSGDGRLFIHFRQAVFLDGSLANLEAEACDPSDKRVGIKGSQIGNYALQLTGSVGLGFLGGFSGALQDTEGQQGVLIRKPTVKNALLNATASTALEQSQNLMSDLKNHPAIYEVEDGKEICVIFSSNRG